MNNSFDEQTKTDEIISRVNFHEKKNFILKRIFIFIFGCLVIWALVIWVSYLMQREKTTLFPEQDDFVAETHRDTDGDGLYDWQEDLYGTSKSLRDTDGDGVSDADEIRQREDPNYFGEGLADSSITPQQKIYSDYIFPTVEDKIIDPLPVQLLEQPGSDVDPLLHKAINDLGQAISGTYTTESQDVDLFNKLFLRSEPLNFVALESVVVKNRTTAQKIRSDISHQNIALELQSFSQALDAVATTLEFLLQGQELSPEEYSALLVEYSNAASLLQKTIVSMHDYVVAKGLVFTAGEPGNYFMFVL